jgi:hypothetical protein
MPHGPGKYDEECALVRQSLDASGVVLLVIGGPKGGGFSVQMPLAEMHRLPAALDMIAREIRADLAGMPPETMQ